MSRVGFACCRVFTPVRRQKSMVATVLGFVLVGLTVTPPPTFRFWSFGAAERCIVWA